MPLRCINAAGEQIHSFTLDTEQWTLLKERNRTAKHLRMPCCSVGVVLKTSPLGTRFFAHSRRGDCTSKPESAEHLMLKSLVAQAIAGAGWEVATEVRGHCPEGKLWIADVMAIRGEFKFAVEIQWSRQSDTETFDRHFRYKSSDVRCLWLFRQLPIVRATIPATQVVLDADGRFVIPVNGPQLLDPVTIMGDEHLKLHKPVLVPVEKFIDRTFSGRYLWFGMFRKGHPIQMSLGGVDHICGGCLQRFKIVTRITLYDRVTQAGYRAGQSELKYFSTLIAQIDQQDLKRLSIATIRPDADASGGVDFNHKKCGTCSQIALGNEFRAVDDRAIHTQKVFVTPQVEAHTRLSSSSAWRIELPEPIEESDYVTLSR